LKAVFADLLAMAVYRACDGVASDNVVMTGMSDYQDQANTPQLSHNHVVGVVFLRSIEASNAYLSTLDRIGHHLDHCRVIEPVTTIIIGILSCNSCKSDRTGVEPANI
jgi:hypothetical protein